VTALLLVGVVVLVLVNGFFVAAEFALVRARRSRVEALANEGARGASLALAQIGRIDEYLSACQLGITMASLGIGFLGEPAIAQLLEEPLGGIASHAVAVALAIAISYVLVTAAHITVGEQVPKIYAITHAESTVRFVAGPLEWFRVATRPLIWALNSASNWMLRLLGTDPKAEFSEGSSVHELRLLIAESATGGHLDRGEAEMLSGVFRLHEQQARQVMTPAPAIVTVDIEDTAESALRRCIESGHTRLVVTEREEESKVAGVVHSIDLARLLLSGQPQASIARVVRPPLIVPETKPLDDLLADLRRDRSSLASVVDEYGRLAGVVSVEDIVEEIVGEIVDETDPLHGPIRQLSNGDWLVRGEVSLADLIDYGIDLHASDEAYTSISGVILDQLGRIPKRGESVNLNGYRVRVEALRGNRIESVRLARTEPGSDLDDGTRSG
jgi:CBS domain containing-hemolysin-like protein